MAVDVIGHIHLEWDTTIEKKAAFLNDFTDGYHYQEFVEDPETGELVPNPVTRKQFANHWVLQHFKDVVNAFRKQQAQADVTWERLELE